MTIRELVAQYLLVRQRGLMAEEMDQRQAPEGQGSAEPDHGRNPAIIGSGTAGWLVREAYR